jgi:D-alanine-D-alanine ligase
MSSHYHTSQPCRIALICGGLSSEREVSLSGARNVQSLLEEAGHDVVLIDSGQPDFIGRLIAARPAVAFIALHGAGGEDGTIQGLLETMGIPYTGSGVLASALAMDKRCSKALYASLGIPTPDAVTLCKRKDGSMEIRGDGIANAWRQHTLSADEMRTALLAIPGTPCIVKPVRDGSSVGVSIVHGVEELDAALGTAFAVSEEILVEAYISGTETTVSVIGAEDPVALPIVEIVPEHEIYDYHSKYAEGGSRHIIPARLSPQASAMCEDLAIRAHVGLGCYGVSRTDIIVDAEGRPWVIETNTIPGMTSTSLLPDAARAAGIEAGDLYDRFVSWAVLRSRQQA